MIDEGGLFSGDRYYDEESEQLRRIDTYTLRIRNYSELKQFEQSIN